MNFGHQIAILRNNLMISQKELAKELQVAGSTVAQWETNTRTPKIEKFVELADFFSVSADLLLSGDRKVRPEDFKTYDELSTLHIYEKTETEQTIHTELDEEAELIRDTFLKLDKNDRYILIGHAMELLKQQQSTKNMDQTIKGA